MGATNDDENNTVTFRKKADRTVAAVHYELKENQAKQINQHEKVQSSKTNDRNADWKLEVTLS